MSNINIKYKDKDYPIKFTNFDKLQMLRAGVAVTDFVLPKEDEPLDKFLNALKWLVKDKNKYNWNDIDVVEKFVNEFEDIYVISGKILLALKRDGLIQLPDDIGENLEQLEELNEPKNVQTPQKEEKNTKKKQKKVS